MRKCIVIGIPSFGTVSTYWAQAYRSLRIPMNSVSHEIFKLGLEVGQARNLIVSETLRDFSEASHIFFLDDDVIPHACCLLQLLEAKKPIVGGVYYVKELFGSPLIFGPPCEGMIDYIPGTGLQQVYAVGGGFVLIETDIFRMMQENLDLGTDDLGNPKWFQTLDESKMNEDYYFFNRAAELNIECWIDMSSYTFAWHFDIHKQKGYPQKQWEEYIQKGTASWKISDEQAQLLKQTNNLILTSPSDKGFFNG